MVQAISRDAESIRLAHFAVVVDAITRDVTSGAINIFDLAVPGKGRNELLLEPSVSIWKLRDQPERMRPQTGDDRFVRSASDRRARRTAEHATDPGFAAHDHLPANGGAKSLEELGLLLDAAVR